MKEKKRVSAYQKLIEGIEYIVSSGKYADFLNFMKGFHHYSFRNQILIFCQSPNATRVAGYCKWRELGRGVKSNPNKIFILRPMPYKVRKNKDNKEDDEKENEESTLVKYGWTIVYDISDTYIIDKEKEISLIDDTKLNTNNSQELYNILLKVSPVKVDIEKIRGGAYGYYSKMENRIVLAQQLSNDDKTAVLLHEISHALYDDFNYSKERDLSEIFVESVAYMTADYFGLDTSNCSFSYIATWAEGDTKKLLKLGEKIQDASDKLINRIEEHLKIEDKQVA